jgi:hypothetical protein
MPIVPGINHGQKDDDDDDSGGRKRLFIQPTANPFFFAMDTRRAYHIVSFGEHISRTECGRSHDFGSLSR